MSWSVSAVGKAAKVREKLAADFDRISCLEPESTLKNRVANAVDIALQAYPEDFPVRVSAGGSQGTSEGGITNDLKLSIEPIYGFIG